jgi:hypothetical protein
MKGDVMRTRLKILIIFSVFSALFMSPPSSFAWSGHGDGGGHGDWGGHGGWHGGGWHGGWGWGGYGYGLNLSYWPDYDDYYSGVLVSPSVVEAPAIVQTPTVVNEPAIETTPVYEAAPQATEAVNAPDNEITLNVPNNSGGYTAVVLKRSGDGYTGPQGEYYPTFPKVSQLSLMYGTSHKS